MHFQGVIRKMISEFDSPVRYYLDFHSDILCMNQLLDMNINIADKKSPPRVCCPLEY